MAGRGTDILLAPTGCMARKDLRQEGFDEENRGHCV
jgi:hypothetical protein